MDLSPGTQLGRFTIQKRLGRGAAGTVYQAADTGAVDGHTHVALKVLSPHLVDDAELRERFRRAVALTAQLKHPGICKTYAVHEEGGFTFLSMQAVDGDTLAHRLDTQGALPVEETLHILRGLTPPLDAAHAHGVVHRDLKPANIMVGTRGQITILDFGMVTADDVTRITGVGRTMGSLRFIAPEVWQGQPATARSDIFALGVVLYACLTGRLPDELTSRDLGRKTSPPPRPTLHNPSVRRTVEAVVRRCMAPDPMRRFASASEVQVAFEEAMAADSALDVARALIARHEAAWDDVDGARPIPVLGSRDHRGLVAAVAAAVALCVVAALATAVVWDARHKGHDSTHDSTRDAEAARDTVPTSWAAFSRNRQTTDDVQGVEAIDPDQGVCLEDTRVLSMRAPVDGSARRSASALPDEPSAIDDGAARAQGAWTTAMQTHGLLRQDVPAVDALVDEANMLALVGRKQAAAEIFGEATRRVQHHSIDVDFVDRKLRRLKRAAHAADEATRRAVMTHVRNAERLLRSQRLDQANAALNGGFALVP